MSYIEVKNISKMYKMGDVEIKALDNTSFTIEKGELVVILGPSGAGKTTCLNILGGMDTATSGSITIDNNDITNYNEKELINYRRNDIGFVFQFYNLIQNLSAIENVVDAAGLLDSGDRARSSVSQQVTSMESGIQSREDKLSGYGF